MQPAGFHLFDTTIGTCAIAWAPGGLAGVQLPEATAAATRARMHQRFPLAAEEAPQPDVERVVEAIRALLRGEPARLERVRLDLTRLEPFHKKVYRIAQSIPPGKTMTYGEIAKRLGVPRGAQAVGVALARNPFPLVVPCHRVVAADGTLGGFSASGGVATKRRLLEIEGWRPRELSLFDP